MLRISIVTLFTFFSGLLAAGAQANTLERVFPQAEQVAHRSENVDPYLLPLGRIRDDRTTGRAQPSKSQRLQGKLNGYTWRLPGDVTLVDAQRQIEDFIRQQNPERLFYCESRDCGESFAWANGFFRESVLFGADRSQYLWVVRDRTQPQYHVFYLIERPNRRIYLHEDALQVPEGMETAEQVALSLEVSGGVRVGSVPFGDGKGNFATVIKRLKEWGDVGQPLLLVLHRHGAASASPELRQQLQAALAEAGLEGRVEDVGALAPDPNAGGIVWVEWVNEAWVPEAR